MQTMHNESPGSFNNLTITVLYDNNPYKEDLEMAWGFSCLLKGIEKTILFDTGGNSAILLANMEKLGIHPEEVNLVVLSHIHDDHVEGLPGFLAKNHEISLYLPRSFPTRFKDRVKMYGINLVNVQKPRKICEHVYSSGELGRWIKEQSLIIQTDKGLIIITGCGHPGIVNIVQKAKEMSKDDVLFVMGGFHSGGESEGTIQDIVAELKKLSVRYVGPCHCSEGTERQVFKQEYHDHFIPVGVGAVITLEDLP